MATEGGLKECCLSGHLHEGQPKGTVKQLYGLETYVAGENNTGKTVVMVTDVFGMQLPNGRLLADEIAEGGFRVLLPDFFNGDSVPASVLHNMEQKNRSFLKKAADSASMIALAGPWMIRHREAVSRPIIEAYIKQVRQDSSVNKIGVVGYCFGGRYCFMLAHDGMADAAVACHPSLVSIPGDYKAVNKPICICVGDNDEMFKMPSINKTKDYFAKELKDVPFECMVIPGAAHGHAIRGDPNDATQKEHKEKSTKKTIDWFKAHL